MVNISQPPFKNLPDKLLVPAALFVSQFFRRFKGEIHLSKKIFIMFDYTFKEENIKRTVSFDKCVQFSLKAYLKDHVKKKLLIV